MPTETPRLVLASAFVVLSIAAIAFRLTRSRPALGASLPYLWILFVVVMVAEFYSIRVGIWILGILCFFALKEYFTLVDIRWQDRWGILGAYAAIPFMGYFIRVDWYGMFIISIPVYAFLLVPLLVALGGREASGTVFSIGAIDFGLFLLVYCMGHLGYLAQRSTWRAGLVILSVALADLLATALSRRRGQRSLLFPWVYLAGVPVTMALGGSVAAWAELSRAQGLALGAVIPALAAIGRYTAAYLEADLRIETGSAAPGSGRILDSLYSFLYVAPLAFHFTRYVAP